MKKTFLSFFLSLFLCHGYAQIITTVAGGATEGYNGDNILATSAELYQATGVAVDNTGNVYIADRNNNRIRKVNTSGIITTIAGTGVGAYNGDDRPAISAEINYPYDITIDTFGNIYFSDDDNNRIRKIDVSGIITTIAGNGTSGYNGDNIAATSAELQNPGGLAVDNNGNVFFCDGNNYRVRKINTSGIITTIAGTGISGYNGDNIAATTAELSQPNTLAIDRNGNIYIADYTNARIRKVDVSGIITTIAGTGIAGYNGENISATTAEIDRPLGLAIDDNGNIYISDTYNSRLREINISGIINTIAGTGTYGSTGDNGPAIAAELENPVNIAIDRLGNIYIADAASSRIRCIKSTLSVTKIINDPVNLIVYPNPSYNGHFTVTIVSENEEQANITITNLLGEKIKSATTLTNKPIVVQLDVRPGVYVLTANDGSSATSSKIIIK